MPCERSWVASWALHFHTIKASAPNDIAMTEEEFSIGTRRCKPVTSACTCTVCLPNDFQHRPRWRNKWGIFGKIQLRPRAWCVECAQRDPRLHLWDCNGGSLWDALGTYIREPNQSAVLDVYLNNLANQSSTDPPSWLRPFCSTCYSTHPMESLPMHQL